MGGWLRKNKKARSACCRLSARTVPDEAAVRLGGEGFNSLLGRQVAARPLAEQADKKPPWRGGLDAAETCAVGNAQPPDS